MNRGNKGKRKRATAGEEAGKKEQVKQEEEAGKKEWVKQEEEGRTAPLRKITAEKGEEAAQRGGNSGCSHHGHSRLWILTQ